MASYTSPRAHSIPSTMIRFSAVCLAIATLSCPTASSRAASPAPSTQPSREAYRAYAMVHQGDAAAGKSLFLEAAKTACTLCHTTDGKGGKAGPDLFAIGDKYGRDDLIQQVLLPSASIAEGYTTTIIRLKSGDMVEGIIKQSDDQEIGLMGSDGNLLRIRRAEIDRLKTSNLSLMPEGLEGALTQEQFASLVAYLTSLKAPRSTALAWHGMPPEVPALKTPVAVQQVNSPGNSFKHPAWIGRCPGWPIPSRFSSMRRGRSGSMRKKVQKNTGPAFWRPAAPSRERTGW